MLRQTHSAWCVLCLTLTLACQGADREPTYDPATMDKTVADSVHPPAMVELAFESNGHRVNGLMYLAQGAGPHPTVILLHGYPGNERNLDLAQALRRAGAARERVLQ